MKQPPGETGKPGRAPPLTGNVLVGGALLAPPVAVFAPLGIAPLLAVLAASLLVIDWRQCVESIRSQGTLAALLALLSLWAAVTSLWSTVPAHSLFEAARLAVISATGLMLLGAARALRGTAVVRLGRAAMVGVAIALILLQIEFWGGKPVWHILRGGQFDRYVPLAVYDRGITVLLLASWPAAAALVAWRLRWALAALGIVAVGLTLSEFDSHASMLAALVGLVALILAWWAPRLIAAALISATFLVAFAYPAVAPDGTAIEQIHQAVPTLRPSAIHRLIIWRFVSGRIAERPLLGWGMDASRALPGGHAATTEIAPEVHIGGTEVLPLHPHDAALQWRVELGAPGALLCVAILGLVLWRVASDRRMAPSERAVALGYAAAVMTVAMLSFGAWQAWWLSSIWLTAALLAAVQRQDSAAA